MKISIITICYNSEKFISRAIESVLNQDYKEIEYIIVDGASKDRTMEIVHSYEKNSLAGAADSRSVTFKIISEKDNGIYDAMNKGIANATGDVVGILNSDDHYASSGVLSSVMDVMKDESLDSCFGNLMYERNGKPYRFWKSGHPRSFSLGWMPPHPAFFVRKSVYDRFGNFRLDCGTAADYELMLRMFQKHGITSKWIDKTLTLMEAGGASGAGIEARKKAHGNDKKAWLVNGLKCNPLTLWFKKIRKLPQFVAARFCK